MALMEKRVKEADVKTVTQINMYIKGLFQRDKNLSKVTVKGEISNCTYHSSGHIYFTLKDKTSAISCIMFASNARTGLNFHLSEGISVLVSGSISVYERDGKYQIYALKITKDGIGTLYEEYEKLKKSLLDRGYFDKEKKKPIPNYVSNIGIVTSPTGAVIQDIQNVAYRRNKYIGLHLYPASVQGEGAHKSIINGIRYFNTTDVDVIIIGRGGGSFEDLFEFNNEELIYAIADSKKPIISAVGHETDYTLSDFAADLRAPTPSAAAELCVFMLREFEDKVDRYETFLMGRMSEIIIGKRNTLAGKKEILSKMSPQSILESKRKDLEYKSENMKRLMLDKIFNYRLRADKYDTIKNLMQRIIEKKRHSLLIKAEKMNGLSPLNRLSGGYAYVSDDNGNAIKTVKDLKVDDTFNITMTDGVIVGKVKKIIKKQQSKCK